MAKRTLEQAQIKILMPGQAGVDARAKILVARGRGGLSAILGDEVSRQRLFAERIDWERVFVAKISGKTVGFLAFQWSGRGPYVTTRADFMREFGTASGTLRWLLNAYLDRRIHDHSFYIYGLKVMPAARRRGVARALVRAAARYAVRLGASRLELEVFEHNKRALAFYSALRFAREGVCQLGWLRRWLGFAKVIRLARPLQVRQ